MNEKEDKTKPSELNSTIGATPSNREVRTLSIEDLHNIIVSTPIIIGRWRTKDGIQMRWMRSAEEQSFAFGTKGLFIDMEEKTFFIPDMATVAKEDKVPSEYKKFHRYCIKRHNSIYTREPGIIIIGSVDSDKEEKYAKIVLFLFDKMEDGRFNELLGKES